MKNIRAKRALVATVAAIAVPAVLFVLLSDRCRACYVGPQVNGCYEVYGQLVPGSGFAFRNSVFGFGIQRGQLTIAVRSDSTTWPRRRDARRAAMAAYIARTRDSGKIADKQPQNASEIGPI